MLRSMPASAFDHFLCGVHHHGKENLRRSPGMHQAVASIVRRWTEPDSFLGSNGIFQARRIRARSAPARVQTAFDQLRSKERTAARSSNGRPNVDRGGRRASCARRKIAGTIARRKGDCTQRLVGHGRRELTPEESLGTQSGGCGPSHSPQHRRRKAWNQLGAR